MRYSFKSLAISGAFFLALFQAKAAENNIPPPPPEYIWDEPQLLSKTGLHALKTLLIEHDHLTGQQIMIGIFKERKDISFKEMSKQIYSHWKVGARGIDNGILLTYNPEKNEGHIEVGFSLDPVLNSHQEAEIIHEISPLEFNHRSADQAFLSAAYLILKAIQSPLVETGKANEILQSNQVIPNFARHSIWQTLSSKAWIFFLTIGIIAMIWVVHQLLARESLFTAMGWIRPLWIDLGVRHHLWSKLNHLEQLQHPMDLHSPIRQAILELESKSPYSIYVFLTQRSLDWNLKKRANRIYQQLTQDSKSRTLLFYLNLKYKKLAIIGISKDGVSKDPLGKAPENHINRPSEFINKANQMNNFAQNAVETHLRQTHYERAIAFTLLELQAKAFDQLKS